MARPARGASHVRRPESPLAAAPQFRLEVGTLASAAFGILLRNIVPFLFLSILIFMPWIAFEFWLAEAELEPERVLLLRPVALLLQFHLMLAGLVQALLLPAQQVAARRGRQPEPQLYNRLVSRHESDGPARLR